MSGMKGESFIRKIQSDPDGLDFDGLRKEGIRLVQEMCGSTWTDYNLHDPGVTMLEQLCYGLTDLAYRAGFSVEDLLADENGEIDYGQLGLYRPDDAFSCGPVTANDYRRIILDAVPNVDNAWVEMQDGAAGLYRVHLQLNERVQEQDSEGARKAYADIVRKLYAANRNLCEDLADVSIARRVPVAVRGEIEIEGRRAPAGILAEIYFECAQYLGRKAIPRSYAEMHRNGMSLEELFTGILTRHGYWADDALHPWKSQFSIQELTGRIARIEGVKDVKFLGFGADEKDTIVLDDQTPFASVACLQFPPSAGEDGIRLRKSAKYCHVPVHDVTTEFERLRYRLQAVRRETNRFDWVDALLPRGVNRNAGEYYSVQNHFPDCYGINSHGIPEGVSPERKAQALRLKGYLLMFEQVMANFLQNVKEIPRLFSLDEQLGQSYFHQVLDGETVHDAGAIYKHGEARMNEELGRLLARFDDYGGRRGRVLDHLLGLYGEKLTWNSLRHFQDREADQDALSISGKLDFLRQLMDSGRRRAAAFNCFRSAERAANGSGLERKLEILLDMQQDEQGFRMVEHVLLRPRGAAVHAGHVRAPHDFYGSRLSAVFPGYAGRYSNDGFRRLAEETIHLNCPAHIHPGICWLGRERTERFGALHENWLACMRAGAAGKIDEASGELILFLLDNGEAEGG